MKKHNLFKVSMLVLFFVMIASWVLPTTDISGTEFITSETKNIGLFNVVSYIAIALQYFCHVALYVLAIGGLYGVLHKIPQYRILLDKIVSGMEGREWIFMVIIGVFFGVLSSMAGLSLPLLVFFPFVVSVILLMGYDKITAAMLTVGSVIAGLIGSVYSSNDIMGLSRVLGSVADEKVELKICLLVVSLAIVLINTILYSKKHQDKDNLVQGIFIPKKVETKNNSIAPLVVVLDLLLIVLALAFISWDGLGVDLFANMTENFVNPKGSAFVKGLYGAFNTVLGISTEAAFGQWTLLEASLVVVLASGLIALLYRKSLNNYMTSFYEGAQKAFKPAILIVVIYAVLVSITNAPIQLSLVSWMINLGSEAKIVVAAIVAIVFSIFGVESCYSTTTAASYLSAVATAENSQILALVWQSMYGLTMIIAPTSIILMTTLSYLDISYGKWLKAIWKVALELLIVILVILYVFK